MYTFLRLTSISLEMVINKDFATPVNHTEIHYPQMEKTLSIEPSQESTTHPGYHTFKKKNHIT